jgi:transcriptional regulator, ArsR family
MAVRNIEQEQPSRDEIALPKVLHALSDPVRLEIVLQLAAAGEIACGCFGLVCQVVFVSSFQSIAKFRSAPHQA